MPCIVLYSGECDGYRQEVSFLERPDVWYAVPLLDLEEIRTMKDAQKKHQAFKERARLAYTYKEVMATEEEIEYRYVRAEDKSLDLPPCADAATGAE